ncbi:MAG TPA: ectoine/hydroxyectoine ABC transporter permease subunit EhuD [Candidatus Sulfomarinibacteraceae bacterium]|nr:ectoine/hydroxyectoine ABC transporter permease subunit EhuD [Candidatus Sulfomarinibacteraceae bacterium]
MNQLTEFFDFQFALEILPQLLQGLLVTIQVSFAAFAVAAITGLLLALGRRSENGLLSNVSGAIVEFVRSTPLLVQLFFFFYVMPRYGLRLPAFIVGTLALGLHYGTYTSEVYRAGIDAVAEGQWEASRALNFSPMHTWTRIILPQAIPPMFPALGNYLVAMFKESALLFSITVTELMYTGQTIGTRSFRYLEPITLVGALYFLLSYPSSIFVRRLEARYAR